MYPILKYMWSKDNYRESIKVIRNSCCVVFFFFMVGIDSSVLWSLCSGNFFRHCFLPTEQKNSHSLSPHLIVFRFKWSDKGTHRLLVELGTCTLIPLWWTAKLLLYTCWYGVASMVEIRRCGLCTGGYLSRFFTDFAWRVLFQHLANYASENLEAMNPPLFLRFLNLLMNDAIFLLDEAIQVRRGCLVTSLIDTAVWFSSVKDLKACSWL